MNITKNVSLKNYSTMQLGGEASYMTDVHSVQEIPEALAWATARKLPVIMIGTGSNIIWTDQGFKGLVLVNKISGFIPEPISDDSIELTVGAGEDWDSVVERSVKLGYSGIEQLSYIPGSTGATPVQNVGAYGQEIADVLLFVEAYDLQSGEFVKIPASDCRFGYRTSRFKTSDRGRFFITSITLRLSKQPLQPPFYQSLQQYFEEHGITSYNPAQVRQAVIAVRTKKLPDPEIVANNGSFFANPIVSKEQFSELKTKFKDIPNWTMPDSKVKIAAGWLIEQAGFPKGYSDPETGMATWDKQALVLINKNAQSTDDLLRFKQKIVDKVQEVFGITLEQEPELIAPQ